MKSSYTVLHIKSVLLVVDVTWNTFPPYI